MKAERQRPFDPQVFLARANKEGTVKQYAGKRVIFSQGDAADAILYIQEGWVKVEIVSRSGKKITVTIVGAGGFLGEECMAGKSVRVATVTTMTRCSIARLEKASAVRLLGEQTALAELFLQHLLSRQESATAARQLRDEGGIRSRGTGAESTEGS